MSNVRGRPELSGHYISKRLRLAQAARQIAGFSLVLLIASVLFFRLGAIEGAALVALLAVVAALAVVAGLIALGGLVRVWKHGASGGGKAVGALVLSLLVLAPFAGMGVLALGSPATNLAVTDGMTATDFDALPAPSDSASDDDALSGRRYQAAAAQVFLAARTVIEDQGLEVVDIVAGDPSAPAEAEAEEGDLGVSGTVTTPFPTPRASVDLNAEADPFGAPEADQYSIVATARDFLLALPSDVEIRIVEDEGSSYVDMRSASREVPYDLGQNRRFIEGFLRDLDDAMAGVENIPASG